MYIHTVCIYILSSRSDPGMHGYEDAMEALGTVGEF
jgi:hypothetical protein